MRRLVDAAALCLASEIGQREIHAHVVGAVDLVAQALLGRIPVGLLGAVRAGGELVLLARAPAPLDAVVRIEREVGQPPGDVDERELLLCAVAARIGDEAGAGVARVDLAQVCGEVAAACRPAGLRSCAARSRKRATSSRSSLKAVAQACIARRRRVAPPSRRWCRRCCRAAARAAGAGACGPDRRIDRIARGTSSRCTRRAPWSASPPSDRT